MLAMDFLKKHWNKPNFGENLHKIGEKTRNFGIFVLHKSRLSKAFSRLKNLWWRVFIYSKWGAKHLVAFALNGVFIMALLEWSRHPIVLVRVISYGASVWYVAWIAQKLWGRFIEYRFNLANVRVSRDQVTDWEKYKKFEFKKRGIGG